MKWRFDKQEENLVFTDNFPILCYFPGLNSKFCGQNLNIWPQLYLFLIRHKSEVFFSDCRLDSVYENQRLSFCLFVHIFKQDVTFFTLHRLAMTKINHDSVPFQVSLDIIVSNLADFMRMTANVRYPIVRNSLSHDVLSRHFSFFSAIELNFLGVLSSN